MGMRIVNSVQKNMIRCVLVIWILVGIIYLKICKERSTYTFDSFWDNVTLVPSSLKGLGALLDSCEERWKT